MFAHISVSALLALPLLASAGVIPVILPRDDITGRQVTISPVLPTLPRAVISRQVVTISPVISPVLPREDGTDIAGRQITIPALPAPPAIPALPTLKRRQLPALPATPCTSCYPLRFQLLLHFQYFQFSEADKFLSSQLPQLHPPFLPLLHSPHRPPFRSFPSQLFRSLAGRQIPVLPAPPAPPAFPAPPCLFLLFPFLQEDRLLRAPQQSPRSFLLENDFLTALFLDRVP
ncbi:hypothetical protein F5146DRAFT_1177723 [Armillaria mellea]|nr:hypothetical protein F5146DRAFT_1177723 [Armillaria mellea]